ncbi:MAG: TorF family putative porin [Gammaproteobacteria bacterium]
MKTLMRKILPVFMAVSLSIPLAVASESAVAEEGGSISYNVGFASEYWYRGVHQSDASVSFGADYENGGFYLGTWWADVGNGGDGAGKDGLEHDYYAGYAFSAMGMDMYVGATGYYYTDNFDSDYEELNFGVSMGPISIDYADGKYDGSAVQDYDYTSIALDLAGIGLPMTFTAGYWGGDSTLKGNVYTLDYSTTVSGVDVGLQIGKNDDDITAGTGGTSTTDTTFGVFSLGYSF